MALASANADLIGHGGMVRSVDFSEDGQRVVTASFDYSVIIWNFEDQRKITILDYSFKMEQNPKDKLESQNWRRI